MSVQKQETTRQNDYDAVPYESFPYPKTHPEHLYTIGKLFDLDAVSPRKCKVLELGCASGGNIIPMAINNPDSEFVGIDLSSVQINQGLAHVEKLGLKNLKLENISITDIDENFGKFDYIIVHGILSWVPVEVQDKIFEVCNNNLTENGIAYISYNTLPGWNMVKSIREMMLYHTANFADPMKKTNEARKLLEFIKDGNNAANPYLDMIKTEIETLKTTGDSYLAHDHLEENNDPFYFSDFMAKAGEKGLQYLGDADVATMFVGNLPEAVSKILMQVQNDVVRTEQYMDFIRNRRFRSTLLCKKDAKINRSINPERISDLYFKANVRCSKTLEAYDINSAEEVKFVLNRATSEDGPNFTTKNPIAIVALLTLIEKNGLVHIKDLTESVCKIMNKSDKKEEVANILSQNIIRLLLADFVSTSAFDERYTKQVSEKPEVSKLARYQATYANWVTNERSEKLSVDVFSRVMLQYLDGANDVDAIIESMVKHVANKELTARDASGNEITDEEQIKDSIGQLTKSTLNAFGLNGLLVK